MNKFKTAALTSALLMAFGVAHAQTAGGAAGLDNSGAPAPGIQSVEETNNAMKGDAMRPRDSASDMKNEKSMGSTHGSSGASGHSSSSGASGSSSSSGATGGAMGLDNTGTPSPGIQSVEETNRAMKGDAMRPQESAGDMKNEKSMGSQDSSSGASGAAGATGSSSSTGSASNVPGTARGLDNSGTTSVSPSPDSANSMTKGDAMRPQAPAGK